MLVQVAIMITMLVALTFVRRMVVVGRGSGGITTSPGAGGIRDSFVASYRHKLK